MGRTTTKYTCQVLVRSGLRQSSLDIDGEICIICKCSSEVRSDQAESAGGNPGKDVTRKKDERWKKENLQNHLKPKSIDQADAGDEPLSEDRSQDRYRKMGFNDEPKS